MGLKPHSPSDYPSFLLYVLDETHLTVTALTASYILYTRSAHSAFFATGALASSLTAKLVKKFIKSPRPPPPPPSTSSEKDTTNAARRTHIRPKKTYGMPSTHSTALTFYVIYLVPILLPLSLFSSPSLSSTATNPYTPTSGGASRSAAPLDLASWSAGARAVAATGVTAYWVGGIWSRVELGYHTYAQCFGGIALGTVIAIGWRGLWESGKAWGLEAALQRLIDTVWAEAVARAF